MKPANLGEYMGQEYNSIQYICKVKLQCAKCALRMLQ